MIEERSDCQLVKTPFALTWEELDAAGAAAAEEAAALALKSGIGIQGRWRMVSPDGSAQNCPVSVTPSGIPHVVQAPSGAVQSDRTASRPVGQTDDASRGFFRKSIA